MGHKKEKSTHVHSGAGKAIAALLITLLLVSCGKDSKGVGSVRLRYRCDYNDSWKFVNTTVYNPERYCNNEFNTLIKQITDECGGDVIIDQQFCGEAGDV